MNTSHDVEAIYAARASALAKDWNVRPDLLVPFKIMRISKIPLKNDGNEDALLLVEYRAEDTVARATCERIFGDSKYGLRLFAKVRTLNFHSGGEILLSEPTAVACSETINPNKQIFWIIKVAYRIDKRHEIKNASEAFHTYLIS